MKRLLPCTLLALALCFAHAAHATPDQPTDVASDQNYAPRLNYHAYFGDYLTLMKARRAEIIFIGDSITEQWRWGAGLPVWRRHFEERAFDFGLGADKTQHTLWRLQNIDLSFMSPKLAVIMIGTNNVLDTPAEIATGVKAVVAATEKKFPGIKVVLMSILPNARANDKMATVNLMLRLMADPPRVNYLDLAAQFTPEGDNWKGLSRDKLHLSAQGYEQWANALTELLPK